MRGIVSLHIQGDCKHSDDANTMKCALDAVTSNVGDSESAIAILQCTKLQCTPLVELTPLVIVVQAPSER